MPDQFMHNTTYKEFSEMTYAELHRTLKKMVAQMQRLSVWSSAAERVNLLPALAAMHDKIAQPGRRIHDPNMPTFEDECRSLGLSAATVRQWRRRTAAETDIRHLLGEKDKPPGMRAPDPGAHARKHLEELCKAVLDGNEELSERLATAYAERYGF